MAKLCEVFDVNNYTFGTEDIIRVFLDEVQGKTTQYQPGKKYFFGDLIITSINNEAIILMCIVPISSTHLNLDEWTEYNLTVLLRNSLYITDTRPVPRDIGGLKAGTYLTGKDVNSTLNRIIFPELPITFYNPQNIFLDINTEQFDHIEIPIKFVSETNLISKIEFYYEGNVIGTSYNNADSFNLYIDVNNIKAYPTKEIKYLAVFADGRTKEEGVAVTLNFVYPTYYGLFSDLDNPLDSMTKVYIKPNTDIEIPKDSEECQYFGIIIQNEQWRQVTRCYLSNNTDMLNSLFMKSIYIDGYEYKFIHTYPTMLRGIKIKFSFDESEV